MYEDYLAHHGIKGMKWGIRRFQNKDGTLTEAGKRRLASGKNPVRVTADNRVHPDDAARAHDRLRSEAATDFRNMGSIAREGINVANTAGTLAKQHSEKVRRKKLAKRFAKMDLSDMSDDDLNRAINRLNLEKRYKEMSVTDVDSGRSHVNDVLQTAGGVLALGASAVAIMAAIEEMKK